MALTANLYTAQDLWQMPGDEPWELWDGELRRVPPTGGEPSNIASTVNFLLRLYLRDDDLGMVTSADGGYYLSRAPDTIVAPDVGFVLWDRLPERRRPKTYIPVPPDLAVEVQSPSDEPKDMVEKRALYARAGVPLLWWIDPATRTVTVHRRGHPPVSLTEADTLDGGDILTGLAIPVADIFR